MTATKERMLPRGLLAVVAGAGVVWALVVVVLHISSAAATYGARGVRVNAVAPGLVDAKMTADLVGNQAQAEARRAMHVLGLLTEVGRCWRPCVRGRHGRRGGAGPRIGWPPTM